MVTKNKKLYANARKSAKLTEKLHNPSDFSVSNLQAKNTNMNKNDDKLVY